MLTAWRRAGPALTRTPRLESRWTRVCFCGQSTAAGRLADHAVFGTPYLSGSEEGRGPLFDATGDIYEGRRLSAPAGVQGVKLAARSDDDRTLEPDRGPAHSGPARRPPDRDASPARPRPSSAAHPRGRAGGRPAGRRAARRGGGYANEYASYFTTPEEYGAQHYEGGTTVYGPASGPFLTTSLADLAGRLARGRPAPAPTRSTRSAACARRRARTRPGPRAAARWRSHGRRPAWPRDLPLARRRRGHRPAARHAFVSVQRRSAAAGARSTPTLACASSGTSRTAARPSSGRRAFAPASGDLPRALGAPALGADGHLPLRRQRAPLSAALAPVPGRPLDRAHRGRDAQAACRAGAARLPGGRAGAGHHRSPAVRRRRCVTLTVAGRRPTVRIRGGLARVPAGASCGSG